MPQIQPVVFPALLVGLVKATASPCKLRLPRIHAQFLDVGSSSAIRKQEPVPCCSSTGQNLRRLDVEEEGREGCRDFWRERGVCRKNGPEVSNVPLSSRHTERAVPAPCSHGHCCHFGTSFWGSHFCHLLVKFRGNCPWSPATADSPGESWGPRGAELIWKQLPKTLLFITCLFEAGSSCLSSALLSTWCGQRVPDLPQVALN